MKDKLFRLGCWAALTFFSRGEIMAQEQCAADEIARLNALRSPELIEKRAAIQASIAQKIHENELAQAEFQTENRAVLTIPVVVHIVYKGSVENISLEQVLSQIDILNRDFRKTNQDATDTPTEFKPFAADCEIEFCLATKDPAGNPTSGITRRSTQWDNVANAYTTDGKLRVCYTALGGTNAWDTKRYLNIWVARIGGGILGFGTFPGTSPEAEDGVFIDPRYFGDKGLALLYEPNHLGRTATHEVGHFLDIYHIWGSNANTCDDDDNVADTPVQRAASEDCPVHPQFSCGNKSMFMNFMDYTDDDCMSLFTLGQKARMRAALQTARSQLLNSNACGSVASGEADLALNLRIFPNPAQESLQISLPDHFGWPEKLLLTDALGRSYTPGFYAMGNSSLIVDLDNLPAGWYQVGIFDRNETARASFLKI